METIGIIGAGTMGNGIAQVFLAGKYRIILNDINEELLQGGLLAINRNIDKAIEKGKATKESKEEMLGNLVITTDLASLNESILTIEAVTEDIEIKKKIFRELDRVCSSDTILGSNTSSMSITELAGVTTRPDKVIGIHFFNPAPVMGLVELIKGIATSSGTFEKVYDIVNKLGKTPVKVEESPGFIVNRILIPMINESICVYSEGVASAEEIDNAMKLGANHPIGPLALADRIGLDVVLAIMDNLHKELGDDKYRPHAMLRKMVRGSLLGKKTKAGFYQY